MHKYVIYIVCCLSIAVALPGIVHADAASDLQQKIDERNLIIKQLDAEIASYQTQIGQTDAKAQTLQKTLNGLNANIKKLQAEQTKTQNNLLKTTYTIQQTGIQINQKEDTISNEKSALSTLIKNESEQESSTLIEQLLQYNTLSDVWNYLDQSLRIQQAVSSNLDSIKTAKTALETTKAKQEDAKKSYIAYQATLTDQQKLVQQSKQDQSALLAKTKNSETTYKAQLSAKLATKTSLEQEINQYEAQLKLPVDFSAIPHTGSGALAWPLDSITITQQFGDTAFSREHAGVYNGNGHNGVDFAASIGTAVKSAGPGFVVGTGNTDTACPGASYGKWILIQHPNGLSTLYGHLSLIKVAAGQVVDVGQVIAYSGNTGYTTGPHLHFTVFASSGVEILSRPSKACNATYTMPLADLKAYLNPLLYL